MNRSITTVLAMALVAAAAWSAPASAQFYEDKTVTMLINYPAGGPTDIEGRIVARHLEKHIPGGPNVIVKNMGGGGGMIATNHLGEVAEKDGLTIGFLTWNVLAGMLGDPGLRVGYDDLEFIAGSSNPVVFYIRKDTPPGIKEGTDLMKAEGFKACSLSPRNTNTIQQVITLEMLGVASKAVPGYKGLKPVEAAILKGECQMANSSLPGWKGSIVPTMGEEVIPLWQLTARGTDGKIGRAPALSDIPTFEEYYAKVKDGAQPSGMPYEALRAFVDPFMSLFRVVFMPPGTPKEAVNTMRQSFASLWKDEAFLSDYEKRVKNRPHVIIGEEGEKRIAALSKIDPKIAEFLEKKMASLVQ